jgi:hypothetical protein
LKDTKTLDETDAAIVLSLRQLALDEDAIAAELAQCSLDALVQLQSASFAWCGPG